MMTEIRKLNIAQRVHRSALENIEITFRPGFNGDVTFKQVGAFEANDRTVTVETKDFLMITYPWEIIESVRRWPLEEEIA